jgi:hypothetical protein
MNAAKWNDLAGGGVRQDDKVKGCVGSERRRTSGQNPINHGLTIQNLLIKQ